MRGRGPAVGTLSSVPVFDRYGNREVTIGFQPNRYARVRAVLSSPVRLGGVVSTLAIAVLLPL